MSKLALTLFVIAVVGASRMMQASATNKNRKISVRLLRANFENQTASAKLTQVWNLITGSNYVTRALPEYPQGKSAKRVFTMRSVQRCWYEWMTYFLAAPSELLPENVTPTLGTLAVVGRIEYVPVAQQTNYTGIFQSGGKGLIQ